VNEHRARRFTVYPKTIDFDSATSLNI